LALADFRLVLTPEQQIERQRTGEPFSSVTIIRVTPPSKCEKGRRKPMTETVAIKEGHYDERARHQALSEISSFT
jgi:hypothetical protein